ncbi:MAG: hypothetical protein FWE98_06005 [Oscillospiraceae bacterium]|nr:hypothetical protein [Oscillospiraceae bacterium]
MSATAKTYALDSMALPLPYMPVSKSSPLVFRLMVALTQEVNPATLQQAVRDLIERFPIMYTRLRPGFIWGKLEDAVDCDIVRRDEGVPCRPFHIKGEKPILRVLYSGRSIAVECTHLTCDANGAAVYLNSLAARYLELQGHAIEKSSIVLDCRDRPAACELEDYYRAAYQKTKQKSGPVVDPPAYQCLMERRPDVLRVTRAEIPIGALKNLLAEKYGGCTVTCYLCAVYACAFLHLYEKKPDRKRPVRLAVSTNLRHFWDTGTLRNFVGLAHIDVAMDRRDYSFRDVLALVRGEMEEKLTDEKQAAFLNQSVRYLDIPVVKIIPGFLKRAGAALVFPVAERRWPHTSTLSNLGYIPLPPSLAAHVESYAFIMGEMSGSRITCTAVGCRNAMTVAFSAVNESTAIQDFCIDFLQKDGLPVLRHSYLGA